MRGVKAGLPQPMRQKLYALKRRVFNNADAMNAVDLAYIAAISTGKITRNSVFYESFHGTSMNCSPRALFEALISDPAYAHLTHIWSLVLPETLPARHRKNPKVRVVTPKTEDYAEALASAEYLVSNATFPTYFIRQPGQKYINTWHGVPLKRMFKYESNQLAVHANSQRNFLHATHLLLPNAFTTQHLLEAADVDSLTMARAQNIGAPRVDETLGLHRDALRAKLGITADQKIVFFAPTWRGQLGKAMSSVPMHDAMQKALQSLDPAKFVVFVQAHNFTGPQFDGQRTVPENLSTNAFLGLTDVLVTDYSSIMFDFFPTGRQVVLFVYDRFEYEEVRGLNAPLESLPVDICLRIPEVLAAIEKGGNSAPLPQFAPSAERFWPLEDGKATNRALTAMFAPITAVPQTRPRILIFGGGFKNNGITSSAINLLRGLTRYDADIYLVTDGAALEKTPETLANIRKVPASVHMLHRAGPMLRSKAENRALERFYSNNTFSNPKHEAIVRSIFRREAQRLLGDSSFDVAIDFSGYARFWSMLIANAPAARKVIYQHNDLLSEAKHRFDLLHGIFDVYKWYDRIVSVSAETRDLNLRNLSKYYPSGDSAVAVRNLIAPDTIRDLAQGALPAKLARKSGLPRFVTAGRMSPEKAQSRMIAAIAALRAGGQEAELLILGSGPLEETLIAQAKSLGVSDLVTFTGQVANPFAIVNSADCFVLSSDYEGQPMVLLEALTLNKPIIASDIAGNRSVLGDDMGLLVPPSAEGITLGMRRYLAGEVQPDNFDADAYCAEVITEFFDNALGQRLAPAL